MQRIAPSCAIGPGLKSCVDTPSGGGCPGGIEVPHKDSCIKRICAEMFDKVFIDEALAIE